MKRRICFLIAVVLCISCIMLCGCGKGNEKILKKSLKTSDLSIEDFEWETVPAKDNGVDCYTFSLVNNSDFDIIAVEFTYKVKDDVSESSLGVYDEFMKSHEGYIEESDSVRDVTLRGSKDALVSKGEQLTGLKITVGFQDLSWYDYPTKEQFELMEPKELEIGVVGEDNTLYIAYYDFVDKIWTLDEKTVPADTWSEKEIAQKISKPDCEHHIIVEDKDDWFEARIYGFDADAFSQYVEEAKTAGFEGKFDTDSYFSGENAEGYEITLSYTESEDRMLIRLREK